MGNIIVDPKDEKLYEEFCTVMNNGCQAYEGKDLQIRQELVKAANNGQLESIKKTAEAITKVAEANKMVGDKTLHEYIEENIKKGEATNGENDRQ